MKEKSWHACASVIAPQALMHSGAVHMQADVVAAAQVSGVVCFWQVASTGVNEYWHAGVGWQPGTLSQWAA